MIYLLHGVFDFSVNIKDINNAYLLCAYDALSCVSFLKLSSSINQSWPEHPVLSRHSSLSSCPSARQAPPHSMSLDYGHHSPPLHHPHIHPAPNAHSSPRSSQRSRMARYAVTRSPAQSFDEQDDTGLGYGMDCPTSTSSLLGNGGMERDLLNSMDGNQNQSQPPQIQPPLLPEKKRASDGEHSLGTASPALSGFSSPHSGSSLSIPFPNVLPDLSSQIPGTASPLPGELRSTNGLMASWPLGCHVLMSTHK